MYKPRYNTFSQRFFAGWIDGLIFPPVGIIDALVFSQTDLTWLIVAWMPVSYSAFWIYSIVMHGLYGQTVGKRFTSVRVLDYKTELPITMWQAFLRESVLVVANCILLVMDIYLIINPETLLSAPLQTVRFALGYATLGWAILEIVTCLFNNKRRAIHDFIAGTVVVRTDFKMVDFTSLNNPA
jgi:uncharacterized RDD family membrane protein YckC